MFGQICSYTAKKVIYMTLSSRYHLLEASLAQAAVSAGVLESLFLHQQIEQQLLWR
jgi:hypothetical protein